MYHCVRHTVRGSRVSPDTNLPAGDRRAGLQGSLRTPGGMQVTPVIEKNPRDRCELWRLKMYFLWDQELPLKTLSSNHAHFFPLLCEYISSDSHCKQDIRRWHCPLADAISTWLWVSPSPTPSTTCYSFLTKWITLLCEIIFNLSPSHTSRGVKSLL